MKTYDQIKAEVAETKARQYRESSELASKAGADLSIFGDIEDVTCQLEAWLNTNRRTMPMTVVVECSRATAIPFRSHLIQDLGRCGGGHDFGASLVQMVNDHVITLEIDEQ